MDKGFLKHSVIFAEVESNKVQFKRTNLNHFYFIYVHFMINSFSFYFILEQVAVFFIPLFGIGLKVNFCFKIVS